MYKFLMLFKLLLGLTHLLCWPVHKMKCSWASTVCTFIYQVASARRQRSDLFGLRVMLPPVTTSPTTQR